VFGSRVGGPLRGRRIEWRYFRLDQIESEKTMRVDYSLSKVFLVKDEVGSLLASYVISLFLRQKTETS